MKAALIRWALRQLAAMDLSAMTFDEIGKLGVEDVFTGRTARRSHLQPLIMGLMPGEMGIVIRRRPDEDGE